MNMLKPTLGILGAGKVGIVLAQLAIKAGYPVMIAGSGSPSKIALTVQVLAPGATVADKESVALTADIIILALPLSKFATIPAAELNGKLVIDAMNYWWEVDGDQPELANGTLASSELIQQYLISSTVVKAFSHIGYHDLLDETRPKGAPDRKAIAIAAEDMRTSKKVAAIVEDFGFDPVYLGTLNESRPLQPGGPVFGAHVSAPELKKLLGISKS